MSPPRGLRRRDAAAGVGPPEAPPPGAPSSARHPGHAPEAPPPAWVATLPPPPFVDPASFATEPRFAPLSPRVAVLIAAAIVIGILLWMARDAVRPFVVGLLLVYLLDPPVRWLVRRGLRRTLAILLVYVRRDRRARRVPAT